MAKPWVTVSKRCIYGGSLCCSLSVYFESFHSKGSFLTESTHWQSVWFHSQTDVFILLSCHKTVLPREFSIFWIVQSTTHSYCMMWAFWRFSECTLVRNRQYWILLHSDIVTQNSPHIKKKHKKHSSLKLTSGGKERKSPSTETRTTGSQAESGFRKVTSGGRGWEGRREQGQGEAALLHVNAFQRGFECLGLVNVLPVQK